MLVVMKANATESEVQNVCACIRDLGLTPHPIPGQSRVAIGVTGNKGPVDPSRIASLHGVIELIHVTQPYKLTSREMKPDDTIVYCGDCEIGGPEPVIIAGPCSVESRSQIIDIAQEVKEAGAHMLRGGAFKPRTSPYAFQGLGEEGLQYLSEARDETGLPIVSEVVDTDTFDIVEASVDIIQIGARNMQNYSLLKRAGKSRKPILLKRWMSATLKEFLLAAEYIMSEGNSNVILCERGIRTFSDFTRFTLDIAIVPALRKLTHLPIIIDPSHPAGQRDLVAPLGRAGIAVGADGLIVEVHPEPEKALSDGPQSLTLEMFRDMMSDLESFSPTAHRDTNVTS